MSSFGVRFKNLRANKGIIQGDLGKIVGVSTSMIGIYEINARKPSFNTEFCYWPILGTAFRTVKYLRFSALITNLRRFRYFNLTFNAFHYNHLLTASN